MVPRPMKMYLWGVIVLAVVCWFFLLETYVVPAWAPVAMLAILAFILSSMAVELPFASSVSMVYAPIFAALLYGGPVAAALAGAASGVSVQEFQQRKPALLMVGNIAQVSLSGMAAGMVFLAIGGKPLSFSESIPLTWQAAVLAPIAATAAFFVVNLALVGTGVALKTGMSFREALIVLQPTSYLVSLLVLTLLGLVMAYLIAGESSLGLLLLVLPFWMAHRTFRVYVELTEAYTSTVRSLVTAIEVKDPYTRGHSERVADYARQIAERMELPRRDVRLVERAALLHDVGKIGVGIDTLLSREKLAPQELEAIREHPSLGSELIADVEFLSDVVDTVRHHHERYDGRGYPDGLTGERIPVLARILAVADAYDAMTSDRAYRPRMTREEACEELRRGAGAQFDDRVVIEFTRLLDEIDRQAVNEP